MTSLNRVPQAQPATQLVCTVVSVYDLLLDSALDIPEYQRPYKWTRTNINQLFTDIALQKDKPAYRLGTIVLHQEGDKKNIVDGQQRTISLLLAARALIQRIKERQLDRTELQEQLLKLESAMMNPSFISEISHKNLYANYREVARIVCRADFTEAHVDFLLNKCQFVVVVLTDLTEAFQFFDSQNARGRDLDPHDLLKAYHLREFSRQDEHVMAATVAHWENAKTKELAALFSQYLYRIRNWSKGASARYFSKEDSHVFKGVNIETVASYPYVEQLRITHHVVDHEQDARTIDSGARGYPFQLDQVIINGRRFFEMISHYQQHVAHIKSLSRQGPTLGGGAGLDGYAPEIIHAINTYPGRTRKGDGYVRTMFDCLLIFYIDKFGYADISRAIEKTFIWAYSLRLQMESVQLASMDNHVRKHNWFRLIKEATHPADVLNYPLKLVTANHSKKTEAIEKLFREMKYYE